MDRGAGLGEPDVEYAGALPLRDGRLLLGLRASTKRVFPDCWDVIGGHVEPGETAAEALVRELGEELGLTPVSYRLWRTVDAREPDDRLARLHLFTVTDWAPAEPKLANDEHSRIAWFDLAEAETLSPLALDGYRALFADLRASLDAGAGA